MPFNDITLTPLEIEKKFYIEYFGNADTDASKIVEKDIEEMIPFR